MDGYARVLPRVTSLFFCISLQTGVFMIGVIGVIFSIIHICFLCFYYCSDCKHKDSSMGGLVNIMKYLVILSDVVYALFSIDLILKFRKDNCSKMNRWIFGAFQSGIVYLVFEFLASPFFFNSDEEIKYQGNILIHWPVTIIFSIIPMIWFYFVMVVTSYYVERMKFRGYHMD